MKKEIVIKPRYQKIIDKYGLYPNIKEAGVRQLYLERTLMSASLSDEDMREVFEDLIKVKYSKHILACNSLSMEPEPWERFRYDTLLFSWQSYSDLGRVEEVMSRMAAEEKKEIAAAMQKASQKASRQHREKKKAAKAQPISKPETKEIEKKVETFDLNALRKLEEELVKQGKLLPNTIAI